MYDITDWHTKACLMEGFKEFCGRQESKGIIRSNFKIFIQKTISLRNIGTKGDFNGKHSDLNFNTVFSTFCTKRFDKLLEIFILFRLHLHGNW